MSHSGSQQMHHVFSCSHYTVSLQEEKKKATSKHREPEKVEEKKDKASKKEVPATRHKP